MDKLLVMHEQFETDFKPNHDGDGRGGEREDGGEKGGLQGH